jgi:hypothetical protein
MLYAPRDQYNVGTQVHLLDFPTET